MAGPILNTPKVTETKPAGTGTRPTGTSTRPAGTGTRPTGTGTRPSGTGNKPRGYGNKSRQKTKESTKRQSMLNTHRIAPFKYDMNEVLSASSMDPSKASSFLATIIAKSSRVSTRDAKDFAKTFIDSEDLSKEEYDKIGRLLDKYSKYR
ncbi:MAG: hypothetical protein KRP56_01350 [Candidatus Methanogranum gryphiswaldense]|nr:MAG: hypothetical protein KRP56_01350 [Candidatus Methanogranum sp. U3.2.1]